MLKVDAISEKTYDFPSIKIASGTLEGLKWLAMICMTIDHINRIFFNGNYPAAYSVGRLAMPLFAFVFAYNIARPDEFSPQVYYKTFKRLIIFGLLATPAYREMMKLPDLFPLNILFTFLVASTTLFFYEKEGTGARVVLCFLIGSIFVDFNWPGVIVCISSWLYCKKPSFVSLITCFIGYLFLDLINDSHWTLLAIPIIMLASQINIKIPRFPYFFWGYYPFHLTVLVLIKILWH